MYQAVAFNARFLSVRSSMGATPPGMLRRVVWPSRSHLLTRRDGRCFTVLALESSADDTCAAVVNSDREVVSNVVVKQHS